MNVLSKEGTLDDNGQSPGCPDVTHTVSDTCLTIGSQKL